MMKTKKRYELTHDSHSVIHPHQEILPLTGLPAQQSLETI